MSNWLDRIFYRHIYRQSGNVAHWTHRGTFKNCERCRERKNVEIATCANFLTVFIAGMDFGLGSAVLIMLLRG